MFFMRAWCRIFGHKVPLHSMFDVATCQRCDWTEYDEHKHKRTYGA